MNRITRLLAVPVLMLPIILPEVSFADWHSKRDWKGNNYYRKDYYSRPDNQFRTRYDQIAYGVRSGRLSQREEQDLRRRLAELERDRARYYRDGFLSRNEREDLWDDSRDFQDELNHNLNDGEKRTSRSSSWWRW